MTGSSGCAVREGGGDETRWEERRGRREENGRWGEGHGRREENGRWGEGHGKRMTVPLLSTEQFSESSAARVSPAASCSAW